MDKNQSQDQEEKLINPNNKNKILGASLLVGLIAISAFFFGSENSTLQFTSNSAAGSSLSAFPIIKPTLKNGFLLDTFHVSKGEIKPNQFLSEILDEHHVVYEKVDELVRNVKDVFDVRTLRAGKEFMILSKDADSPAQYFLYEPDVYSYVVYDIENASAKIHQREVNTEVVTASGIIESSLWQTMVDNELSYDLASRLEDVFGWSIDFHHIQNGDKFKVIYEKKSIEGQTVGAGEILGAYYKNYDNEYYGILFENDKHKGYYDLEARPMKKNFLKSPVKYSRISSRFNRNRFHPVLKRRKAHLGTDYAAPRGTPIYSVANGVVTKASRTRGNGKYVKIKHDATYQTQYLHMNGFAKGIKSGVHVKQGQVIGYVGSTGLATGPHVCFRFWKNGRQVNHLRLNFPPPEPMPEKDIPRFNEEKDKIIAELNNIEFKTTKKEEPIAEAKKAEKVLKEKVNP